MTSEHLPKNQLNHLDNLARFTGWKGKDWWENGVCNPRKKLDPVTQAYVDTILANARGRDRAGNPIFHK